MTSHRARADRPLIAVVASWYPSDERPVGGIFVRDQAEILAEAYDVVVVAPRAVPRRPPWRLHSATPRRVQPDRIPTIRPVVLRIPGLGALSARLYERAVVRSLRRLVPGRDPDVLHAHVVLPAGLAAARAGRRLGIPVVITEHSSPFSMHLATSRSRVRAREALRGAVAVLAVGEGLRREIVAFDALDVDVVPNLVSSAFFATPLPTRHACPPFRLLAVGYLTRQKRYDVLIEAVRRVVFDGIDVRLTIVGDGPTREDLLRQALEGGIADRVEIVAMGSRADVIGWLGWSDALVSSSDHESFGLVIAEALAFGRPVIATRSGGPDQFVHPEQGILVRPGDPAELASAIERLPEFIADFEAAPSRQQAAAMFGPEAFLARMGSIYQRVLQGPSR